MKDLADRFSWMRDGACVDMDTAAFFPGRNDGGAGAAAAKQVCASCDVKEQCLELALTANDEFQLPGIWGGTSSKQRRQIRRDRKHNERRQQAA